MESPTGASYVHQYEVGGNIRQKYRYDLHSGASTSLCLAKEGLKVEKRARIRADQLFVSWVCSVIDKKALRNVHLSFNITFGEKFRS